MKRNHFFKLILSAVVLFSASFVTSCTDAEADVDSGAPSLGVSTNTLLFDADGVSADDFAGILEITSNRDWEVVVPDAAAEWLTVSPTSGSGDGKVSFSMPASNATRQATVSVKIYNAYGTLAEESVVVKQTGSNSGSGNDQLYTFDGSELPTSYSDDSYITVNGVEFTISFVANYTATYPDSTGPIQFSKSGSYLYNNMELEDLNTILIELRPAGTSYNNFEVFAGTAMNPEGEAITPTKSGDICTYTLPEGSTFFSVENNADYTSYANLIEVLCGDAEGTLGGNGGGTEEPEEPNTDEPTVDGDPAFVLTNTTMGISGSELSGSVAVEGINFDYAGLSTDDTYGTIYIDLETAGYIANTTAISELKYMVVNGNGYVKTNLVVTAGASAKPTEVITSSSEDGSGWGSDYVYIIPEGAEFVQLVANPDGTYDGSVTSVSFYTDGEFTGGSGGGTEEPDPEDEDKISITLKEGNGLTQEYATGVFESEGASFAYYDVCYNSYGSYSIASGDGYICNETELVGLSKIVVTEDYEYYNFTLYVGTEANPRATKVDYTLSGDEYTYTIPEGNNFFAFVNEASYSASGDQIKLVFDSLGETTTVTPPVEEELDGTYLVVTPEMLMGGVEIVDGENTLSDITIDLFDFAFVHGSTNSRVWQNTSGVDIRFYKESETTISSESATITRIIFDAAASKVNFTVDSGEIVDSEWSGSTKSLTLTATATSTVSDITIVYEE